MMDPSTRHPSHSNKFGVSGVSNVGDLCSRWYNRMSIGVYLTRYVPQHWFEAQAWTWNWPVKCGRHVLRLVRFGTCRAAGQQDSWTPSWTRRSAFSKCTPRPNSRSRNIQDEPGLCGPDRPVSSNLTHGGSPDGCSGIFWRCINTAVAFGPVSRRDNLRCCTIDQCTTSP